jgi:hypothetical protein
MLSIANCQRVYIMTSMGYLNQQTLYPFISHHIFHKDDRVSHEFSIRSLLKHNFLQLKPWKTVGTRKKYGTKWLRELPTGFSIWWVHPKWRIDFQGISLGHRKIWGGAGPTARKWLGPPVRLMEYPLTYQEIIWVIYIYIWIRNHLLCAGCTSKPSNWGSFCQRMWFFLTQDGAVRPSDSSVPIKRCTTCLYGQD